MKYRNRNTFFLTHTHTRDERVVVFSPRGVFSESRIPTAKNKRINEKMVIKTGEILMERSFKSFPFQSARISLLPGARNQRFEIPPGIRSRDPKRRSKYDQPYEIHEQIRRRAEEEKVKRNEREREKKGGEGRKNFV